MSKIVARLVSLFNKLEVGKILILKRPAIEVISQQVITLLRKRVATAKDPLNLRIAPSARAIQILIARNFAGSTK